MTELDQDLQWVTRAQQGDVKAFEALVLKYRRRVERLIARMVRDTDLVEDIAQEAFLKAYRALPQFRGDSAFYTWLYRIAVNTAKKTLMSLGRDPLIYEASRPDDDEETSSSRAEPIDEHTPDAELASRQVAAAVNAAIEDLGEEFRTAIMLREIEGLSYETISEMMECPVGTVRSRIYRAREAIAKRLQPLLDQKTGKRW